MDRAKPPPRGPSRGHSPEPRFARVAAGIADPTRARMLSLLMDGNWRTAGELAAAAGIAPPTASAHLAVLHDTGLVAVRAQGRHRYFRLADSDVAHALEALSTVAERPIGTASRWQRADFRPLKAARTCYGHLAGELGVALLDGWLRRGTLAAEGDRLALTPAGRSALAALGIDLPRDERSPRFAYRCIDWSERRDHLAGALASRILDHGVAHDWWRRVDDSRALRLTPAGRRALEPWLQSADPPPESRPADRHAS